MKFCTVQFNYSGGPDYGLLLDILLKSIDHHMPGVHTEVIKITPPRRDISKAYNLKYNTEKLQAWYDYLGRAEDDVIFLDCDMVMNYPVWDAFEPDFDVGYTARTKINRIPMNGGVMLAKNTALARSWYREMLTTNIKMYADEEFHNKWRRRYAGMNQSAFGYMKEASEHPAKLHAYQTIDWNAVDCDWPYIHEKTRFVHIKSSLRKHILKLREPFGNFEKAMKIWYREAGINPENPPAREKPSRIKNNVRRRRVKRKR